MLWKVQDKEIRKVTETKLPGEEVMEEQLEEWIEAQPEILGEPLLIIGRQVQIADVKEKLDLLALDQKGNTVIIELKRDLIGGTADFQAIRYASYVSRWTYDDIESQAETYFEHGKRVKEFNFVEELENFCEEGYELNQDQRIILAGHELRGKIGSVALWLLQHNIDVKVVEVSAYRDGDNLYLVPQVVIPPPTVERFEIGKKPMGEKPWLKDGQSWHIHKRCGEKIASKLMSLTELISSLFSDVEGPCWNQREYVSFLVNGRRWITIETFKTALWVALACKEGEFDENSLAQELGIGIYDKEATLSEKLKMKSALILDYSGKAIGPPGATMPRTPASTRKPGSSIERTF